MTTHRTRPPDEVARIPYEIIRVGPSKVLEVYCLSDAPVVIAVHWVGNRAIRCPENECMYCDRSINQRWRGYLFGQSVRTGRVGIIEYTGGVGGAIADEYERHQTLRGAHIILARKGKRKNGPMAVEFGPLYRKGDELPDVPELFPLIARIYDWKDRGTDERDGERTTVAMKARHA
jgi:hypothetical protein